MGWWRQGLLPLHWAFPFHSRGPCQKVLPGKLGPSCWPRWGGSHWVNRGLLWEWVTCTQHPMSQVRKLSLGEVRDPPKVINRNLGLSHRWEGVSSRTLSSELSWFRSGLWSFPSTFLSGGCLPLSKSGPGVDRGPQSHQHHPPAGEDGTWPGPSGCPAPPCRAALSQVPQAPRAGTRNTVQ